MIGALSKGKNHLYGRLFSVLLGLSLELALLVAGGRPGAAGRDSAKCYM